MSTHHFIEGKCAVCGAEVKYAILGSTNQFGSPDLDGRPSEMARSTMGSWVHECPNCGYVSDLLSDPTIVTRESLDSEEYRGCGGLPFDSFIAERFYKDYLICREEGNHLAAFSSILCAAWDCDDNKNEECAVRCRELAAACFDDAVKECEDSHARDSMRVIKADVLRRSGHFHEMISEYSGLTFDDKDSNAILEFQLAKAREGDTGCYRMSDVIDRKPGYTIYI